MIIQLLLLLSLLSAAAGATTFRVPAEEALADWRTPARLAGLVLVDALQEADIRCLDHGSQWELQLAIEGEERRVPVAEPGTPAAREDLAQLAASLYAELVLSLPRVERGPAATIPLAAGAAAVEVAATGEEVEEAVGSAPLAASAEREARQVQAESGPVPVPPPAPAPAASPEPSARDVASAELAAPRAAAAVLQEVEEPEEEDQPSPVASSAPEVAALWSRLPVALTPLEDAATAEEPLVAEAPVPEELAGPGAPAEAEAREPEETPDLEAAEPAEDSTPEHEGLAESRAALELSGLAGASASLAWRSGIGAAASPALEAGISVRQRVWFGLRLAWSASRPLQMLEQGRGVKSWELRAWTRWTRTGRRLSALAGVQLGLSTREYSDEEGFSQQRRMVTLGPEAGLVLQFSRLFVLSSLQLDLDLGASTVQLGDEPVETLARPQLLPALTLVLPWGGKD